MTNAGNSMTDNPLSSKSESVSCSCDKSEAPLGRLALSWSESCLPMPHSLMRRPRWPSADWVEVDMGSQAGGGAGPALRVACYRRAT
jgi:hypothetical protein